MGHGGTGEIKDKSVKLCACGCGNLTSPGRKYIKGHAGIGENSYNWKGGAKFSRKRRYRKIKNNPKLKLRQRISSAIGKSLNGKKHNIHWECLVGYSLSELKTHLETQFKPGMSWQNHSIKGWHIDHKIPVSAFNFKTPDDIDFKRCWALSNLQPLWAKDNIIKSNKLEKPFQPSLAFGGAL